AVLSAFVGPIWLFLDPFSTLYDLAAAVVHRLRADSLGAPAPPPRLPPPAGNRLGGPRRLPGAAGPLAGRHRLRLRRLARACDARGRAVDPVHRPPRLHRLHARDDGPVRPR